LGPRALTLVGVFLSALALPSAGLADRQTTNPGAYVTIRVTITDEAVTMRPKTAPRGSFAIFVLANHSTTTRHSLLVGDVERGPGRKIGFLVKLAPNEQKRIVMFLDYRGPLPYSSPDVGKPRVKGIFRVI
jgi:hypothetical protein